MTDVPATHRIRPWARQYFYWRHPVTVAGVLNVAGPDMIQVKIGADIAWRDTTLGTDVNGIPGWRLLIAGPDATSNPGGTVVVQRGPTPTDAQIASTEIAVGEGFIDCRDW